jgi:hypothetical protein
MWCTLTLFSHLLTKRVLKSTTHEVPSSTTTPPPCGFEEESMFFREILLILGWWWPYYDTKVALDKSPKEQRVSKKSITKPHKVVEEEEESILTRIWWIADFWDVHKHTF